MINKPNFIQSSLNIKKNSDVEKILFDGFMIILAKNKKISDKKIKKAIEDFKTNQVESKTVLETNKTPVIQFNTMLPRVAETSDLEPYNTELSHDLDRIVFTYDEKFTIKTAFLYAEKEGLMVPEKYSSNQEILGLLERAFNKCSFPGELSGKIQKILKKYL